MTKHEGHPEYRELGAYTAPAAPVQGEEPPFERRQFELYIIEWQGQLHCACLNNHRIAGGKPWGGGRVITEWKVAGREILAAFPELQIRPPQIEPLPAESGAGA